jgi:hypothetical protein
MQFIKNKFASYFIIKHIIMNFSFTKMFTMLFVVAFMSLTATAQNVIWTQDFGGGALPAAWTNVDALGNVAPPVWTYTTTGVAWTSQPPFSATTAANGFAYFNSDAQGSISHDVQLTTDAIDCSTLTTVVARFSNQYAYYSNDGSSIPELGVSTDGTTFTYYPILELVAQNDLSDSIQVEEVDISTQAAGSSTVYLQFRWRGFYEYDWKIDDIMIQDALTPLPPDNVALASGFHAIASSYQMPKRQVDTIRFLSDVANIGGNVQTNVTLTATVVRGSDNATVFSESYNYGTLMPGDTVENYLFAQSYVPDTISDSYTGTYTLTSDAAADTDPSDNTYSFDFEVTDGTFSKALAPTASFAPAAPAVDWTVGTEYFVYEGTDISGLDTTARYANAITFGVSNVTVAAGSNALPLEGLSADLFLETADDLNDNGVFEANERTVVAFGSHTFVAADDNVLITVPIDNFTGANPLYQIEDNTNYLVTVKYTSNAGETMFFLYNDDLDYSAAALAAAQNGVRRANNILDVNNTGDYGGGFQGNPTPLVGLETTTVFTTSSEEVKLTEKAFTVFPNPASEFTTATIALEETSKNARITVYNVQGQVMEVRNLSNVQNELVRFDLDNYASGTYLMSIDTDNGHAIKRFIVRK